MIETFKILIEEPEKLKKFIVLIIRIILISIFTSLFYSYIFGIYELLDYKSNGFWNDLYHFFITGRVLIVALIYLTCKVILFDVFAELLASLFRGFVNKVTNNKSHFKDSFLIRFVLNSFGILSIDTKTKKVSLGKNYEQFYDILSLYQDKEGKNEIHGIKNSLMNETLHSYFVFTILFFFFLDLTQFQLLTAMAIIGLILTSLSYFSLCIIIEFFEINAAELLFGLNLFKQEKIVTSFLNEHHIQIIDNEERPNQLSKRINFKNAEYSLEFYPGKSKIMSHMVKRMLNRTTNNNLAGTIIITDKPISEASRKLLKANKNIKVICAKTEKKLLLKLEKYFFEK